MIAIASSWRNIQILLESKENVNLTVLLESFVNDKHFQKLYMNMVQYIFRKIEVSFDKWVPNVNEQVRSQNANATPILINVARKDYQASIKSNFPIDVAINGELISTPEAIITPSFLLNQP